MTDLPDDETVLARFREWLRAARAEADGTGHGPEPPEAEAEGPEVGLYRLVEEFTALRHEVKLQTKSARVLQDQTEALLPALGQAIEQFRAVGPKEEQAVLSACRPLAEAMADLDEALDRGRAGVEKARARFETAEGEATEALSAELDALRARQPWHRRLWLGPYHDQVRALLTRREEPRPGLLDAMLEGYGLIQSRLRRAMDAEQIRRVESRGRLVDPERMTVVEVVDAPGVPPGHVVDELRRGYTWRGRVLRFAEVRASRLPPTALAPDRDGDHDHDPQQEQAPSDLERADPTHGNDHRD
jgi:molecular chaperone GrpE